MRSNRQSTRRRGDWILLVLAALVLAALVPDVREGAANAQSGSDARLAPAQAFERARSAFESAEYRVARDLVAGLDAAPNGVDAQHFRWLRAASVLRQHRYERDGDAAAVAEARRELEAMALEIDDEWSARAYAELLRFGATAGVNGLAPLEPVLRYWEDRTDIEVAARGYVDLAVALLGGDGIRRGSTPHAATLQRMWTNLVRADVDDAMLEELGRRLLGLPSIIEPRLTTPWFDPSGESLAVTVARDLAERTNDRWLRAHARYVIGRAAESDEDLAAAVRAYRAVLAIVDADDAGVAQQAEAQLLQLTQPSATLQTNHLYRPGSHHRFALRWRNLSGWEVDVRRLDLQKDVARRTDRPNASSLAELAESGAGERVWSRSEEDAVEARARAEGKSDARRHRARQESVWIDPLDPGVYLVEFRGRTFGDDASRPAAREVIVVGSIGVLERTYRPVDGAVTRELWLVDMSTGEPLDGVDLIVEQGSTRPGNGGRSEWSETRVRTGDDGRAMVAPGGRRAREIVVRGSYGGQPILFMAGTGSFGWRAPDALMRSLIWSDRPLYRPGETVHLQAFVRELDVAARDFDVLEGEAFTLRVTDPQGETWLEREARLDANGSIEVDAVVPADVRLGQHRVSLSRGRGEHVASGFGFEVAEVRLPEFTVEVGLDDERRFVLGDTLEVDVSAAYLFGGAVVGSARVAVTEQPVYQPWLPWRRMPWLESGALRVSIGSRIWPGHDAGETILETTVDLDADGNAVLRIPTRSYREGPEHRRYVVEATVTDASRRQESGSGSVTVGATELTAWLHAGRSVVAPGDPARIELRVQDAMRRGVAHEGTIEVVRLGVGDRLRPIESRTVRTEDDGSGIFEFRPPETGHYRVDYRSVDGRGFDVEASCVVWVADPRTVDIPSRDGVVRLIPEAEEVLGDVARVLLLTDTPGRSVLLTRTHAGGAEVEVIRMRGTSQLLEVQLDARHRPAFDLHATTVSGFRVHSSQATVATPAPERLLDLEIAFDAESALPGATAPLRVRATDADGRPVSTLLSVAVVDGALLAIAPRPALDPLRAMLEVPRTPLVPPRSMGAGMGGYALLDPDEDEPEPGSAPVPPRWNKSHEATFDSEALMSAGTAMRSVAAPQAADADMGAAAAPFEPANVRSDFRTTALWRTGIVTDENGTATVDVPLPESLTRWDATVLALDPQTRVGTGDAEIRTRKPVMLRLQHPRVFRGGDRFVVAGIVHNETDRDLDAKVQLSAVPLFDTPIVRSVSVPAGGQERVEWTIEIPFERASVEVIRDALGRVVGVQPATVSLEGAVRTDAGEDALRRSVDLLPFGTGLHIASTREVDPGTTTLTFDPITDRLPGSERVSLTVAPSMLSAAIDALPGLAAFPYGCVEQTLSRYVPAVAVRAVAQRLDVDSGRFDPELDDKLAHGLDRIAALQNTQGGWSWWGGKDRPTHPYITAYVLVALAETFEATGAIDTAMLRRGREALRAELPGLESRPDDMAYALFALGRADRVLNGSASEDDAIRRWTTQLLEGRDGLTPYARALTALALQGYARYDDASLVLRHLENDVRTNDRVDTVHWGRTSNFYWRGHGAVETTAFVLQAMVAIDPDHPRRASVARWLVMNRRGHQWDSTRSSAHALFALTDHLEGSTELAPDYTLIASQNGTELARVRITPQELLDGGGRFELPASVIDAGAIELRLEGTGRAYVTFEADAFSRARTIEPSANIVAIEREVVRLVPERTLGRGVVDFEVPLEEGDAIASGDRLRVKLRLRADHDVDFVMIDDPRVAGAEPTEQLSGWFHGGSLHGHREIRDARTVFFVDTLREGEHELVYEVVAESPGTFHVAPARASAMYLPDVAGHGRRITIEIAASSDAD